MTRRQININTRTVTTWWRKKRKKTNNDKIIYETENACAGPGVIRRPGGHCHGPQSFRCWSALPPSYAAYEPSEGFMSAVRSVPSAFTAGEEENKTRERSAPGWLKNKTKKTKQELFHSHCKCRAAAERVQTKAFILFIYFCQKETKLFNINWGEPANVILSF